MTVPSSPGKRPPVIAAAAAAAGVPFDVATFMPEVVPAAAKAAMTPPLSTAVAPSEEANLHLETALRRLVRALARQAARESAAELTTQPRAAAKIAPGQS